MAEGVCHITFVGIYADDHNDSLRHGLTNSDVSFSEVSLPLNSLSEAKEEFEIPLLTMRATMNWFSSGPSWLFPILASATLLYHTIAIVLVMVVQFREIQRADVLVVPHMGDTSVIAVKSVAVLFETPLIYLSHNGMYFSLIKNRGVYPIDSIAAKFIYHLERFLQSVSDKVVVFSDECGRLFSQTFGHPEEKYQTIYISVDESKLAESQPTAFSESCDVTYWGNFLPHHDPLTMLGAAGQLPEVEFVFAGPSDNRAPLEEKTESIGADNITFPGFVGGAELVGLINSAKVVLGPVADNIQTRFTIGTKVAEAAYLGKAIVVGDNPAVNEVFEHGVSAYLVEPGDPDDLAAGIREILENDELRERLETGSREVYTDHFASAIATNQLIAIANDLVDR